MYRFARVAFWLAACGLLLGSLALLPVVREEASWVRATVGAGVEDYSRFIAAWPAGRHAGEAKRRHETGIWAEAIRSQQEAGFLGYLRRTHLGLHRAEVAERIETLRWDAAVSGGTIRDFQQFFSLYPTGQFAGEADRRIAALLGSEKPFKTAIESGLRRALEAFLADYPGHIRTAEVRAALADMDRDRVGRHVVDLLSAGKIEAQPSGAGIDTITIACRSLVNHPLKVLIPAGTYFRSSGRVQNMICTSDTSVELGGGGEDESLVRVACCNMGLDSPESTDGFEIRKTSTNPVLQRLVAAIRSSGVEDTELIQSAVWIVTDDAGYKDLVEGQEEDEEADGETEADTAARTVEAMRLCMQSGVDMRERTLWHERDLLRQSVTDRRARRWLDRLEASIIQHRGRSL